jgi:paraquat-inducible protein B
MSKKANPAAIGAFVIAALAIAVGGILVMGSGKLFKESEKFVLYFGGSLSGLDVGAPVEYNGIRVGEVVDINMVYNTDTDKIQIPVYIELEHGRMVFQGAGKQTETMNDHIKRGIRAQLQSQSFVTGKMKIMLMLDPSDPARLVGADTSVTEIPTKLSLIADIGKSINELPLTDIIVNLSETVEDLAEIAASGDIQAILSELRKTAESLATMADKNEIQKATQSFNETLTRAKELVENLNQSVAPVQQDLSAALNEFAAASKSARHLLDYLDRHPEALLRGKGGE